MSEPKPKRLFVAVKLAVASERKIAEAVDRLRRAVVGGPGIVWVPPANLHVTVKFLGWSKPEAVAAVRLAVSGLTEARQGLSLEAAGAGGFPRNEAARVLWIGVRDGSGALGRLAEEIDARCASLGFVKETRAFHPHVTIGRARAPADVSALLATLASQSFGSTLVSELVLYESVIKSIGSDYSVLHRWPLGGAAGRTERQTRSVESVSSLEPTKAEEPDTHGRPQRED
jgi:2'-5' RNA ligase